MRNVTTRPTHGRSLRTTHLILAFIVAGILITGSVIATFYINTLNTESAESIQVRNTAAELLRNIRDHVWSVETDLNTIYISQTLADKHALIIRLDHAIEKLELLRQLKIIESTSLEKPGAALYANLNNFKTKIRELLEKSKDPNWVYPILPYISDTLLKTNQKFTAAISIALNEINVETSNAHSVQMYIEITSLLDLWQRQILDFRAILIRIVALNQAGNLTQPNNIRLRHEVILEKIDSLEALYKQDPFGFNTEESINTMRLNAIKWYADLQSFGLVLESHTWRSDIHLIKNEIVPIQQLVANNLSAMELIVQSWSTANVHRIEAATKTVIFGLWMLTLFSLLFVSLIYNIISKTLLKPIAQLSDDIVNDINNSKPNLLPLHRTGLVFKSKEVISLLSSYNDMKKIINERDIALTQINHNLEEKVKIRTAELENSNNELRTFNYSVSHDLRSPLRSIDGFSLALLEDYEATLDSTAKDYLKRIRNSAQRMGELIDDMLKLSAISRRDINRETVDLSSMVNNIFDMLIEQQPDRKTEILVEKNITAEGDKQLLQIALENLLGNAWKYSNKETLSKIQFGITHHSDQCVYFIKDNGAGFNMEYVNKLFGVFQRLHGDEYEGTGIGLATVKRIIERHGGKIWANSKLNIGSTFYFTLG